MSKPPPDNSEAMGIRVRLLILLGALVQCSLAASSSKRAENIKTLLTKQEVIRADKYIANAQHHFGQYQKVSKLPPDAVPAAA